MNPRCFSLSVIAATLGFLLGQSLSGADAQWDFNGTLDATTPHAPLVALAAFPAALPEVTFEELEINGQFAEVAHFTRGTYFDVPHDMPPNGGGAYVNQFTLIMDVMFPDRSPSGGFASLLQTNCCNQNDGDWFIDPAGGIGILGSYAGSVPESEWHRLALVVDLTVGTMTYYVDGVQVQVIEGEFLDGRFSLYSPTDGDPDPYETFFIFADESGDNAEGFVNSVQFHDLALDPAVMAKIGGPSAAGIPRNVCVLPPAVATRDIATVRTPEETNGDFLPGDLIDVAVTISDIRAANPPCAAAAGVVVVETLPAGWIPSEISAGGVRDPAMNTITWTVTGAAFSEGRRLTYKVTAAATTELGVDFTGTIAENVPGARASPVRGESRLLSGVPFDACGGIRSWNILGAYRQPFGDSPGEANLRLDYLTDGDVFETDFLFFPGAQVATAFGGDGVTEAVSTGIAGGASGRNPTGVPTVFAWNDRDGFVNLNDDVFGGDPNDVMAYAQAYVVNTTAEPMDVFLGISSDDAVEVLLNGEEVWFYALGRAGADACMPQDVSPDGFNFTEPHVLDPGENSLLLKVWEGGGGWNFAIRFQTAAGDPITEGLEVRKYPGGICTVPPLRATRTIGAAETVLVQCVDVPRWRAGETYDVTIALSDVRAASASCAVPAAVRIEETVPAGWTPSAASMGGRVNGGTITWTLTGAAVAAGSLTYRVQAAGAGGDARFRGRVADDPSGVPFAVEGASLLTNPEDFSAQGFVKNWLFLGPYQQPALGGGPAPDPDAIREDHLTDGAGINEVNVAPRHGDTVNTDYGGAARSVGLAVPPNPVPINPGGVPTWKAWRDLDDTIDFNAYYGGDVNLVMMYAVTYIRVDGSRTVDVGLSSDDSVQVLLDGREIHLNSVARSYLASNVVQDVIPGLSLSAGIHKLMVKVFEGNGAHGFRLRFQDAKGEAVTEGIEVCLDPECADRAPPATEFHRGDADGNAELELTDAVRILNFLFLGTGVISCFDAADADDNGGLELTDAVRILNFLFLGTGVIPAPGPTAQACGPDPTDTDPLDCDSYRPCE
jgi:hypothetical protein